tara:strand:- start:1437 stop:2813 length:1377 start_codon:yes stop_codon:yes gene_type:complete
MGPYAPPETKEEPVYFGETKTVRTGQEPYRLRTPTERLDNVISTGLQSEHPEVREASSKLAVQQLLKQPEKTTRLLTPQEKIAAGYNEKSVVQIEPDGTHNIVKKYEEAPLESKTFYRIGPDGEVDPNSIVSVPFKAGERNEEYRALVNDPTTIEGKPPSSLVEIVNEADPVPTLQEQAKAALAEVDRTRLSEGPMFDAYQSAPLRKRDFGLMRRVLKDIDWTGKGKVWTTNAKEWLKTVGIDPERFGLADDTTAVQLFENLRNQATMSVLSGMSGSVSEGEILFASETLGSLSQTKEALETTLEILENAAVRDQAYYNAQAQWISEHGRITNATDKTGRTFEEWTQGYKDENGNWQEGEFYRKGSKFYSPLMDPESRLEKIISPELRFQEKYLENGSMVIEFGENFPSPENYRGIDTTSTLYQRAKEFAGNSYQIKRELDDKGQSRYTWQKLLGEVN